MPLLLVVLITVMDYFMDYQVVKLSKLQRIENAAARLVTNSHRLCHVTPILRDLHWLPVKFRIDFKILLMVFKCLQDHAPTYVSLLQ